MATTAATSAADTQATKPIHQWTHGGDEVLIVRFVDSKHQSHGGFQHPTKIGETVTAPDWNDREECGGGTGYAGAASSTGDAGAASSTGTRGAAVVTGPYGKARGGKFGCIALNWWNVAKQRYEMRCAVTGNPDHAGSLKADTWYRLSHDTGEFVEVEL